MDLLPGEGPGVRGGRTIPYCFQDPAGTVGLGAFSEGRVPSLLDEAPRFLHILPSTRCTASESFTSASGQPVDLGFVEDVVEKETPAHSRKPLGQRGRVHDVVNSPAERRGP